MNKCVALVSGGLDSICYLAQQIGKYEILPLVFNYGQLCHREIEAACHILEALEDKSVRHRRILRMEFFGALCPGTQLTDNVPTSNAYQPSVVVPLRNAMFLSIAAAHAKSVGATRIITGAHTDDGGNWLGSSYPMYPDRTNEFLKLFEAVLDRGHFYWMGEKLEIWTPAREGLSKVANLKRGMEVLGKDIYTTWSCHVDGDKQCGGCLSCQERKAAFKKAGIEDRTEYGRGK